jgi:GT2 family glycosyltransferase
LRQDAVDFDVLVWDASKDDATERVVERNKQAFDDRGIGLIYRRAKRIGLVSQRNDAVREAKGDVVFFIDDDCEVSCDGLSVLADTFNSFPWLMGCGLPLFNKIIKTQPSDKTRIKRFLTAPIRAIMRFIFSGMDAKKRAVRSSTGVQTPSMDLPGEAEWLSGGSMAFRREVFGEIVLDEDLERFGGYAVWEDVDFSHRVFLHFSRPLLVSGSGLVVHHAAPGQRIYGRRFLAARYYNMAKIRRNYMKYKKYPLLPFIWEFRIGETLTMLWSGAKIIDIVAAYKMARQELDKQ